MKIKNVQNKTFNFNTILLCILLSVYNNNNEQSKSPKTIVIAPQQL